MPGKGWGWFPPSSLSARLSRRRLGETLLRSRRSGDRRRASEELLGFVAADPADDPDPAREVGMLGELDDRARRPFRVIRHREDEGGDIAFEQGADAHR